MKKEIVKLDEVQKLPKEEITFVEKLDFSELIDIKAGGDGPVQPSKGSSGGVICWCS